MNNHKEQDNRISATLNLLKCDFDRAVESLQEQQACTKITCKDLKQKQEMITEDVKICWETTRKLECLCKCLEAKSAFMKEDLDLLTTAIKSLSHSIDFSDIVFVAQGKPSGLQEEKRKLETLKSSFH